MVGLTWEDCEENQRVMVIVRLAEELYGAKLNNAVNWEEVEKALFEAIEARWREQDMEIDAREIDGEERSQ